MFKFVVMDRIHKYNDSLCKIGNLELRLHLLLHCVRAEAGGRQSGLHESAMCDF